MPKYQIILSSDSQLSDQEFNEWCKVAFGGLNLFRNDLVFKILDARNLEGIRKELWDQKEQLKKGLYYDCSEALAPSIEQAYEDVVDLFKIGD